MHQNHFKHKIMEIQYKLDIDFQSTKKDSHGHRGEKA